MKKIAAFEKYGFKVAGLAEVTGQYIDIITGEREKKPAIKMQRM